MFLFDSVHMTNNVKKKKDCGSQISLRVFGIKTQFV